MRPAQCVIGTVLFAMAVACTAPAFAGPTVNVHKAHHAKASHPANHQGNSRTSHPGGTFNGRGPSKVKLKHPKG